MGSCQSQEAGTGNSLVEQSSGGTTNNKAKTKKKSLSSASSPPSTSMRNAFSTTMRERAGHFHYQMGTCALEYWEPIKEVKGNGSIGTIHLVRRRPRRVSIPYREKNDIMNAEDLWDVASADDPDELQSEQMEDGSGNSTSPSTIPTEISVGNSAGGPSFEDDGIRVLKSIHKEYVRNDEFLQELRNEITTMSHLEHENIARVYEAYERKRHIYLIMEYCRGGDLWSLIDNKNTRKLHEKNVACIIAKVLSAVQYLHQFSVVHRDLKLENIMLSSPATLEPKLIDFGLAARYLPTIKGYLTERVGTLYCMEPRIIQGEPYDYKCDLWSIGVITYVLLSGGTQPFWGSPIEMPWAERKKEMMTRIVAGKYMRMKGPNWEGISTEAKNFCKSLLQVDPAKRPTATQALNSKWIQRFAAPAATLVQ